MTRTPVKRHTRITAASAALVLTASALGACGDRKDDLQVMDAANEAREELAEVEADFSGESSTFTQTMKIAGREREYLVTTPPNVDEREGLPLIFAFHGYKMTDKSMRSMTELDKANAVVVYMQGVNNAWAPAPYAATSGEEDLEFFDAVRQEMLDKYPIDPSRVFAAGHSNGGGFAAYTACNRAHQLTGIGTVSAAYYDDVFEGCSAIPTKQIDFHGTKDNTIDYDGGDRHDAEYESVTAVMEQAAKRNYCDEPPETETFSRPGEEFIWEGCDAQLRHYRLDGSGHIWPGSDSDKGPGENTADDFATREMLDFFGVSYRENLG